MAFTGLWNGFWWSDGTVMRIFIVTTNATDIHERLSVTLEHSDGPTWLGKVVDDPATLLRPSGDAVLACEWG